MAKGVVGDTSNIEDIAEKLEFEKQLNINTARSSTPELVEHYIQNELGDGSHYLKAGKFLWEGLQKKKTPYISSTYQKLEDDSE